MLTKSVSVRIPKDLYEYLSLKSKAEHRTLSNTIIFLLSSAKRNDFVNVSNLDDIPTNAKYVVHHDKTANAPDSEKSTIFPGVIGRYGIMINTLDKDA